MKWLPGSAYFKEAGASGLTVTDWQNVILVNQAGLRFYDETAEGFSSNRSGMVKPYEQGSYRNLLNVKMDARSTAFLDAAMAGIGEPVNGGGPIWAIFDADAVKRENWNPKPPDVDIDNGFFFEGSSLEELAEQSRDEVQAKPLPAAALQDTVARYNSFVDAGRDADFDKPKPKYKIQTAPFYAAWATPVVHDTRAGLRINAKCQVVDLYGKVIPGLYAGGECAGGFSLHGLARVPVRDISPARKRPVRKLSLRSTRIPEGVQDGSSADYSRIFRIGGRPFDLGCIRIEDRSGAGTIKPSH